MLKDFTCKCCGTRFSVPERLTGNTLVCCPCCYGTVRCYCGYDFAPIDPCFIYCGRKLVGTINKNSGVYFLESPLLDNTIRLSGGYKGLSCYKEACGVLKEAIGSSELTYGDMKEIITGFMPDASGSVRELHNPLRFEVAGLGIKVPEGSSGQFEIYSGEWDTDSCRIINRLPVGSNVYRTYLDMVKTVRGRLIELYSA